MKPLLNVATSVGRSRGGTSSGPREGRLTAGSEMPGYSHVRRPRVVDPRDAGDESAGYDGSERKLVTSTGGRAPPCAYVARQTPSPGSAGWISRRIGFGR